ncbi:HAD family hydrolase [Prauserella marina]|uniref:Putative hydrolase of the HAD superfamily n=1 Tax=Prauserella marina TaxID=530584 RepID=A0A222VXI5_9PSEU|nr:HAD family phosphatase [Prauserella marina]ASR38637.1 HAD family hydrolase [Prauserella marina]PWV81964.1 putative hydrolase of the HAD superfamily [Prauserella marina]SDD16313.1 putative hydrolase of the HAD superfamily [Prauserella marina]
MSTRWVVFDYGEVISTRTVALPAMARLLDVPPRPFTAAYWAHRDAYDRGGTDEDFWQAIADTLGIAVGEATVAELTELDIQGWSRVEPDTLDMLSALAEAGTPLALLSNAPTSFARFAERQPWAQRFRVRVFSGDVGVAKPDEEIFSILLAKLEAAPEDCLFFDDRQANVDAARTVGLRAHRWSNTKEAHAVL